MLRYGRAFETPCLKHDTIFVGSFRKEKKNLPFNSYLQLNRSPCHTAFSRNFTSGLSRLQLCPVYVDLVHSLWKPAVMPSLYCLLILHRFVILSRQC